MSLRAALRAAVTDPVACCAPLPMQHATGTVGNATAGATEVQQPHANPHECSLSSAPADARARPSTGAAG